MIIDPNNRPQRPDSWYGNVLRMVLIYCEPIEEAFPDYWNDLFAFWTEPFPVRQPKPCYLYSVHHLQSFIKMGYYDDWPDTWWSILEDAFMYPEYKK